MWTSLCLKDICISSLLSFVRERQVRNEIDLAGPEGFDAMKVDNIRPQKIDSPYTTRSTWLAQKALSGMKVVAPRLNWIPLSSTLGHGVSVLAFVQVVVLDRPVLGEGRLRARCRAVLRQVKNFFFVVFRYKLLVLAQLDLLRSWKETDPYLCRLLPGAFQRSLSRRMSGVCRWLRRHVLPRKRCVMS